MIRSGRVIDSVKRPLRILYVDTESFWRGGQEQLFSLMVGNPKTGLRRGVGGAGREPAGKQGSRCGHPHPRLHPAE